MLMDVFQSAMIPHRRLIFHRQRRMLLGEASPMVLGAPFAHWILFYTVNETEVLVERILHGARDLDAFFDD